MRYGCADRYLALKYTTSYKEVTTLQIKNKQFVLSGTAGEQWAIDFNKLCQTYTFVDGTPITPNTLRQEFMQFSNTNKLGRNITCKQTTGTAWSW